MNKPKIGKSYVFVRSKGSSVEHTEFTRHEDGSAGFAADGCLHVHEGGEDAWVVALEVLRDLGFQELIEARASGLVPHDWKPTPETHVLFDAKGGDA